MHCLVNFYKNLLDSVIIYTLQVKKLSLCFLPEVNRHLEAELELSDSVAKTTFLCYPSLSYFFLSPKIWVRVCLMDMAILMSHKALQGQHVWKVAYISLQLPRLASPPPSVVSFSV